jgi:hypothetical protein
VTPVKSSNIAAVDHDGQHTTVQFKSGAMWRYADVPADKHESMVNAASVGGYFAQHIRPNHDGTRLDDTEIPPIG